MVTVHFGNIFFRRILNLTKTKMREILNCQLKFKLKLRLKWGNDVLLARVLKMFK